MTGGSGVLFRVVAGAAWAAGWFVVVVVATATAIGMVFRLLGGHDAPDPLLTVEVAEHPVASALILIGCLVVYGLVFRWLCGRLRRWRGGADAVPPSRPRTAEVAAVVDWAFSRWYRASLLLALLWLPWYLTSFPGQPNPDFARMLGEFLLERSDFTGDVIAPYEAYPTSSYLMTDSERIWSNHHNFFLMLAYGGISWVSIALFDTLMPGIVLIAGVAAVFTLVAFGKAFAILGRLVPSWKARALAFALVAGTPTIALWSMSHSKNHLFAAALVWWLALLAELVHTRGRLPRRWYVESVAVAVVIAVTVLFGWILLVVQAVALLLARQRLGAVLTMAVPALALHFAVSGLVAAGAIIPSDPIETKGLQLQQLALILKQHPDALSEQDRADLERIFDIEAMTEAFDPDWSDPVKSSGPFSRKTDSYRYQTVGPEDWDPFHGIYLRAGAAHPDTFLDGLVLKGYRYLDPLDRGTNWYPPWSGDYDRVVGEHRVAPVEINRLPRTAVRGVAFGCYEVLVCRPFLSHSLRTVALVLICAAAIAVGRRQAWLWSLPFVLQLGVNVLSPLSAGGRYALGFTYALGIVVLLMAIEDRRCSPPRESTGPRTATGSPGS